MNSPPTGKDGVPDGAPKVGTALETTRETYEDEFSLAAGDSSLTRWSDLSGGLDVNVLASPPLKLQHSTYSKVERISNPLRSSLVDDDYDDELFNYFNSSRNPSNHSHLPRDFQNNPHCWIVDNEAVPILPSFYPLLKSSVSIPNGSARGIAERIQSVLCTRSIVATYDSRKAKADCTTKNNVNFRIRLYRGNGNENHSITVEIQRREGFDLMYHKDVYAIFDAAEGKIADSTLDETPVYYRDDCTKNAHEGKKSSLTLLSDLLCPEKGGETVEGMQLALLVLTSLTSVDKMGRVAAQISKDILYSAEFTKLRDAVFFNICSNQHTHRVMLQSLEILANLTSSLHGTSESFQLSPRSSLVHRLISLVENADVDPRAADLSCLILKNTKACQALKEHENVRLMRALKKAASCGKDIHADLELHSQQCLELLP
ncbi:hypothetical protein HJC23_005946 [Cyclotella cryptica]|uniref:Uncharacterized protein n=1 Tax=Cyclotella cryptica TaxID=29204 RepID=A0ABD3R051_9STRA|eukprot:CCRYP_000512-RA/>CCRYP_000512-RA protein AED:0.00 eAED:0.00 QI:68/-1/1/1/-1/1/1/48/430